MTGILKTLYAAVAFGLVSVSAAASITNAQAPGKPRITHSAGLSGAGGYIFQTNPFFKGENSEGSPMRQSFSTHLKYSFRWNPGTYFGDLYPYTSQGIGLAYNSFCNNTEIGSPTALFIFQNSRIASLTPNLSLDYEWNFGISFGWRPFDEESNIWNYVVGSKMNAYINLGLLLNWSFAPHWSLTAGAALSHYSNGNTKYPNAGVNTIEGRLGIHRSFGGENTPRLKSKSWKQGQFDKHVTYDIILYGAARKKAVMFDDGAYIVPGKFGVAGFNFNPLYNFSRFFRAGLSLDMQFDESANIKDHIANDHPNAHTDIKFHRPPAIEQISLGISARAEIVMPIFSINIGIGKNLLGMGDDTESFYQIFALKADVFKDLFIHIGYQLYRFKDPNNLMIGIGYRFNSKKMNRK